MDFIEKLKDGISKNEFLEYVKKEYPGFDFEAGYELLKFQGLPLEIVDDLVILKTALIPYEKASYCVVDIEVNNSKPNVGQVIEIGAVKIENLEIVDSFDFLIYADNVPKYVERVTGINQAMLKGKSSQKDILKKFRLFLGDSIFVAHPADFDYNFLAYQFQKENLGEMLNRYICTLTLAQKTLKASRYGLKYLMEEFNFPEETHHRALGDAKTTARVFLKAIKNLPKEVVTAEDLIAFSKPAKKKKKKNQSS